MAWNWRFWNRKPAPVADMTPEIKARSYKAASHNYNLDDWLSSNKTANEEILAGGETMRNRAREAVRNDEFVKKFIKMNEKNIVGSGLRLQVNVLMTLPDGKRVLNKPVNDATERAWKRWGKKQNCSTTRRNSWLNIQQMWAKTMAGDGEIFIQKIQGFDRNPFGFALFPVEGDLVPFNDTIVLKNGNSVVLGCEIDKWGAVVAFHFNPTIDSVTTLDPRATIVPADKICHGYLEERPGQYRGVTHTHAALALSHIIKGYREATVTGARQAACTMGTYTRDAAFTESSGEVEDLDSIVLDTMAPATNTVVPSGYKFELHGNPISTGNAADFNKQFIRAMASGLDVNYNVLAEDFEGVNFSSLRGAVVQEQEGWKILQRLMIEDLAEPTFEMWFPNALARGQITLEDGTPLSPADFETVPVPEFIPRPFPWVDPLKDAQRSEIEVKNGWNSDERIAKQKGVEHEDMIRAKAKSLAMTKKIFEEEGVSEFLLPDGESSTEIEEIEPENEDN